MIKNCKEYNGSGVAFRTSDVENIIIENVDFINNHDQFNSDGVGNIGYSVNVTIKNTNWKNNSAVTGSALRYENVHNLKIDSCTFIDNISSVGGVIWGSMSIGSIKNSLFVNNSGVLSLQGYEDPEWPPYSYTLLLNKNTIVNNENPISFVNYGGPPSGGAPIT